MAKQVTSRLQDAQQKTSLFKQGRASRRGAPHFYQDPGVQAFDYFTLLFKADCARVMQLKNEAMRAYEAKQDAADITSRAWIVTNKGNTGEPTSVKVILGDPAAGASSAAECTSDRCPKSHLPCVHVVAATLAVSA
jgi:hypothetical protein